MQIIGGKSAAGGRGAYTLSYETEATGHCEIELLFIHIIMACVDDHNDTLWYICFMIPVFVMVFRGACSRIAPSIEQSHAFGITRNRLNSEAGIFKFECLFSCKKRDILRLLTCNLWQPKNIFPNSRSNDS